EQLPVAVLVLDREHRVELANRAAQELLATSKTALRGLPLAAVLGRAPDLERALAAAHRGSNGSAELTLTHGELPLRATVVPSHAGGVLILLSAVPAA